MKSCTFSTYPAPCAAKKIKSKKCDISMKALNHNTTRTLTPAYFTLRNIFLPMEMIILLSRFLTFKDFRNLVQAMWPNGEEDETFRERLLQLSLRKFWATFLNGKKIRVVYSYDHERFETDRLRVDLLSILPLLGGEMPPGVNRFMNKSEIKVFLKTNVSVHLCEGGIHSPCLNNVEDSKKKWHTCPFQHFHHYCPKHVCLWFEWYLIDAIAVQEKLYQFTQAPESTIWLDFASTTGCDFRAARLKSKV